jgi:Flp pilus assembly protein TadD
MLRFRAATILVLACLSGSPQSRDLKIEKTEQKPSGRRALLIGNSAYLRVNPLHNAAKDARDLGSVLGKLGFETTVRVDAKSGEMNEALRKFAGSLGPGDIAFFFYAGHGVQIDGANYLIPTDFAATSEPEAKRAGMELGQIQAILQRSGARLTVMAIDACRNNPLRKSQGNFRNGFAPMESGAGGLIAFSTGPGQTASDGEPGGNGLYTAHLLKALPEPIPLIGIFRKVRDDVYEATNGAQRPYVMEDVIGDYYISRTTGGTPQTPPTRTPPPNPPPARTPKPDTAVTLDADQAMDNGMKLFHAGDFPGAATAFDLARRIRPQDAYAYNAAGLAYANQGKFQIAADLFSKAISLNPAYAAAYFNRGLIYMLVPQYQLAVQDFTWAVEADPTDPLALTRRGTAYLGMREYESAAADFQHALEIFPDDFEAQHGMGVVAYRMNNMHESLDRLNAALILKSDFIEAYEDRARTEKALGMAGQAEQDRQTAARLRKGRPATVLIGVAAQ